LWTAGVDDAPQDRAGLTVSSIMVAGGEPARVLALLDPDADLTDRLLDTGRAVVHLLGWEHHALADVFAGVAPAPGGMFRAAEFEPTAWGPRLVSAPAWAGVTLESSVEVGWSTLVTCVLDEITIAEDVEPLVHRRGRYQRPR
jgi:flavin reductase (DIM6/NTAB) family NADH-FMN oxidoreductase RutF